MRSRYWKQLALLVALGMLLACLTGCEALDYRKAVQLYNARQYEEAADLFYELGDYEDSKQLKTQSMYWDAVDLMVAGEYSTALPRFIKLGDFEDSAQRATECKYQMAIAAFNEGNDSDAGNYFQDIPDYRLSSEYLRQLRFQSFYEYIAATGEAGVSATINDRTVTFLAKDGLLTVTAAWEKDMGYIFADTLTLALTQETTVANFTATRSFAMDFAEDQIGTTQTGTGVVDLAVYTPGQALALDSFSMSGTDNLGNDLASQDPAKASLGNAMAENLAAILELFPQYMEDAGVETFF